MSYDPSGAVPPQPPPPGPPYGAPPAAPQNEMLAQVSLGTGIAALVMNCCCGWFSPLLGIAALVTGFLAIKKINESNGLLGGKTLAIAGMVCGGLGIVLFGVMMAIGVSGAVFQELQKSGKF